MLTAIVLHMSHAPSLKWKLDWWEKSLFTRSWLHERSLY